MSSIPLCPICHDEAITTYASDVISSRCPECYMQSLKEIQEATVQREVEHAMYDANKKAGW